MSIVSTAAALIVLASSLAAATETEWIMATGNWSAGENWSNGEPTAECRALVATGTATITQTGEVCSDFRVGPESGSLSFVQVNAGELVVSGTATLDRGLVSQFSGTVSIGRLQCGGAATGSYTFASGALTVGTIVLGSATRTGGLSVSSGTFTASDSTIVNLFGSLTLNGFNTTSILGHTVVEGGLGVANGSTPIQAESLVLGENARILTTFGPGFISLVDVSGPVVVAGSLQVQDPQEVVDGTYEFIRGAGGVTGAFTSTDFPSERWSWFIEGNSLFIRKGDEVPVQGTSWGALKRDLE